jgi:transposase-like protein
MTPTEIKDDEYNETLVWICEQLEKCPRISRVVKRTARHYECDPRTARRWVNQAYAVMREQRGPAKQVDYERTEAAIELLAEHAGSGHAKAIKAFDDLYEKDPDVAVRALTAAAQFIRNGVQAQDRLCRIRGLFQEKDASTGEKRPVMGLASIDAVRARLVELEKRAAERKADADRGGRTKNELDA